jgi:transposase
MSTAYVGEGKTDVKDAYVIAETARLRRDLPAVPDTDDSSRDLALLTARRADLVADRVRMLNRLRSLLTSVSPALERAFDYSTRKGALVLLTGYPTPPAADADGPDPPRGVAARTPRHGLRPGRGPRD